MLSDFLPGAHAPWATGAAAAGALAVALLVDQVWGEPPVRWHPVVWMGRYLEATGQRIAPTSAAPGRDWRAGGLGALAWCLGAAVVVGAAWAVQGLLARGQAALGAAWAPALGPGLAAALAAVLGLALLGVLLKPLLAWALLRDEVRAVEQALAQSLGAGRERLSWLVSRDVGALSAVEVRESAIETLAENLSDSVVAPVFWFLLLGLPGAALYRFANTADAMWGYPGLRGGRCWQWAGKWAARADDVLSWVPARITALLLAAWAGGLHGRGLAREARKTPSPNSGWPMAAMALALGVRLAKPGSYALHAAGGAAQPADTRRAVNLASKVVLALVPIGFVAHFLMAWLMAWAWAWAVA